MELEGNTLAVEKPLYNIGAVERMTGIPVATLRMWERRYHFPEAARTPGRHRLYSEREVQRLQWIKSRLEEGLQIRQAIQALKLQEQSAPHSIAAPQEPWHTPAEMGGLAAASERLMLLLLQDDIDGAEQLWRELLALHSLETLALAVLRPALAEIGEAWLAGRINVAQEHRLTHYLRHKVTQWINASPPPYALPPVLLAGAPGELHEGSLLILALLLRRRLWPVTYLGPATPLRDLAEYAATHAPAAIVLAAMTEDSARALTELARWLPPPNVPDAPLIAFGGRIFNERPAWRDKIPGVFLGATLEAGFQNLDRWLQEKFKRLG